MRAVKGFGKVTTASMAVVLCLVAALPSAASPLAHSSERSRRSTAAPTVPAAAPGTTVLVWSQYDGLANKLAWSRLEGGRWIAPHYLTFGPGDDLAPVIGRSRAGTTLYWIGEHGRVFYASFDSEAGRLFAVPRPLPISSARSMTPEGSADAPIVLGICGSGPCPENLIGPLVPGGSVVPYRPEGGADAPIVLTVASAGGTTVTATSSPSCSVQIVATATDSTLRVYAIDDDGRIILHTRSTVPPDSDLVAVASGAVSYWYPTYCE
jgi:hypothetical protein